MQIYWQSFYQIFFLICIFKKTNGIKMNSSRNIKKFKLYKPVCILFKVYDNRQIIFQTMNIGYCLIYTS